MACMNCNAVGAFIRTDRTMRSLSLKKNNKDKRKKKDKTINKINLTLF